MHVRILPITGLPSKLSREGSEASALRRWLQSSLHRAAGFGREPSVYCTASSIEGLSRMLARLPLPLAGFFKAALLFSGSQFSCLRSPVTAIAFASRQPALGDTGYAAPLAATLAIRRCFAFLRDFAAAVFWPVFHFLSLIAGADFATALPARLAFTLKSFSFLRQLRRSRRIFVSPPHCQILATRRSFQLIDAHDAPYRRRRADEPRPKCRRR